MQYDLCQIEIFSLAKAYLMVSNSLTLESWKVRSLRQELEFLTKLGLFFTFLGLNELNFQANFHKFSSTPVILLELLPYLNMESKTAVKLPCETREILLYHAAFLKFCES